MLYNNLFSSVTDEFTVGEEAVPLIEPRPIRVTIPELTPARWLKHGGRAMLDGGEPGVHMRLAKAAVRRHLNGNHAQDLPGGPTVLWATALPGRGPEEARKFTTNQLGTLGGDRVTVHGWSPEVPATPDELRSVAEAEGANMVVLHTLPCLAGTPQTACRDKASELMNAFKGKGVAVLALHNHPNDVEDHPSSMLTAHADLQFKVHNSGHGAPRVETRVWAKHRGTFREGYNTTRL